jgi:GT2 family glycosyltransferase
MTFDDFISDLLFIVVLYRKKITESDSIQSILSVLEGESIHFFIYDNSPGYNSFRETDINGQCSIKYIPDTRNSGVSMAYNAGAMYALEFHKKRIMLCDQDTFFTKEYFERAYEAALIFDPPLAAPFLFSDSRLVSPCGFFFNYGYRLKSMPDPGWNELRHRSLLNSGMVIMLEAFMECGGYNEKVFLDFADSEFIKRYRKKYSRYYQINAAANHHLESSVTSPFNPDRFRKYCRSIFAAAHGTGDLITISFIVVSRTLRQMLRHKTLEPLKSLYEIIISKENVAKP